MTLDEIVNSFMCTQCSSLSLNDKKSKANIPINNVIIQVYYTILFAEFSVLAIK